MAFGFDTFRKLLPLQPRAMHVLAERQIAQAFVCVAESGLPGMGYGDAAVMIMGCDDNGDGTVMRHLREDCFQPVADGFQATEDGTYSIIDEIIHLLEFDWEQDSSSTHHCAQGFRCPFHLLTGLFAFRGHKSPVLGTSLQQS